MLGAAARPLSRGRHPTLPTPKAEAPTAALSNASTQEPIPVSAMQDLGVGSTFRGTRRFRDVVRAGIRLMSDVR